MSWTRERKLAAYEALVSGVPDVERKGRTMPYTSMNGNMFSFLSTDGVLALRLERRERDRFLDAHPEALVVQHGAVMHDYVEIPVELLDDPLALEALFAECVANARTLKPKPTKR